MKHNGNMLQDLGNQIAFVIYDINNLPVTVYKTDNSQWQYSYDANGNRFRKYDGIVYTYYVDGADGKTEAITLSNLPTTTYNLWGNDNVGKVVRNGTLLTRFYYLKDHLGSVRMTVDAAGSRKSWNDYYPFGLLMEGRNGVDGDTDPRYKFTSKERDVETGNDYFGARYYDSRIGRWLSVDPKTSLHADYSPYVYVYDNPTRLIDHDGQDSTQKAAAVAEAKKYVDKNPNKSPTQYKLGAKGGPGQPTDCSGLTSNCVVTAGVADPNHGNKNGVANTVNNTRAVDMKNAQPGNLVVFTSKSGTPSQHIGILTDVQQSGSAPTLIMVQSGVHTGPAEVVFKPGVNDPSGFGMTFQGVRAWDTPDPIGIWSSSALMTQFQIVVSDQTCVNH